MILLYSHLCSNLSRLVKMFELLQHELSHFEKYFIIFKETGTKLKHFEKRKVHVNDRLSPNYLILLRKVTGDEVVFLCVPVLS